MSYKQDGHSGQFTSERGCSQKGQGGVRPQGHWSLSDCTLVTGVEKALFLLKNDAALCPSECTNLSNMHPARTTCQALRWRWRVSENSFET